jgi:hypothetical protein
MFVYSPISALGAVIVNKNTQQTPLSSGKTGTQIIKLIPGPRVYVKAKDSSAAPVTTKSAGTTPAGWTDLGIVNGNARLAYDKELFEVRTGIDQVLRQQYVRQRTATAEFALSQVDDVVLEQVTGLTASQIVNASVYQFAIGQEDIVEKALLLVMQNKLDGKEMQFYNPAAQLSFTYEEDGEAMVIRVRANLPAFTFGSADTLVVQSVFA